MIDLAPFFATSTLAFDFLVFANWMLTNMYTNNGSGRRLKSTYLSPSIMSLTTTHRFPIILLSSSIANIETCDPVSIMALSLLPHIEPSISNGLFFGYVIYPGKSFSAILHPLLHLLFSLRILLIAELFQLSHDVAELTFMICRWISPYVVSCKIACPTTFSVVHFIHSAYWFSLYCCFRAFCHSYPHRPLSFYAFFIGYGIL